MKAVAQRPGSGQAGHPGTHDNHIVVLPASEGGVLLFGENGGVDLRRLELLGGAPGRLARGAHGLGLIRQDLAREHAG
jgi:hypothetical protein